MGISHSQDGDGIERICQPTTDKELFWEARLPNRVFTKKSGNYGAALVAARYCGIDRPLHAHALGDWQHGWVIKERNTSPESVVGHSSSSLAARKSRFWVARKDQADFLLSRGFRYARAIGLPICYVPRPRVERLPRSLLIMPVHTVWKQKMIWDDKAFSSYLSTVIGRYDTVAACLHTVDYAEGRWLGALRELDIPVIAGARSLDANALHRMATLFSMFETILTNGFGSHWAYAQLFGARVAVDGPFAEYEYHGPAGGHVHSEAALRQAYPGLFRNVEHAACDIEWARKELGCDQCLSPAELRHELGWSPSGLVQWAFMRARDRATRLVGRLGHTFQR